MKTFFIAVISGFLFIVPKNLEASFYTGNEMYGYCTSKRTDETLLCLGLVTGYYEGMQLSMTCDGYSPKITTGQLHAIVVKYMNDHPDKRHLPSAALAIRSFVEAFACHERISKDPK